MDGGAFLGARNSKSMSRLFNAPQSYTDVRRKGGPTTVTDIPRLWDGSIDSE